MAKKPTRTAAPIQSKAKTAGGFKFGLDNMVKASKASMPCPQLKDNLGKSIQPRPGVWHPGAEKP